MNPTPLTAQTLDYPDVSMAVIAPSVARLYGNRPAIVDGDEVCTYRDLYRRASAFAAGLRGVRVREGASFYSTCPTASTSWSPITAPCWLERR